MSAAGAGAAAAGAAAARRRREQRQEEERMTGYTAAELAEGWEFKILRSATGAFKKPEQLRRILEEESRAGWVMIEKFDAQRVRLKRPVVAKSGDSGLPFDPYRTTVGISEGQLTVIIVACAVGAVAAILGIIVLATQK